MDDDLDDVLWDLIAREPLFHRSELAASRAAFDATTVADFWEVGASGRVYTREVVWDTLVHRYAADEPDEWATSDYRLRRLAPDVYLLTYVLRQGDRRTRRATVWERAERTWRVVYHQGTVVSAPA